MSPPGDRCLRSPSRTLQNYRRPATGGGPEEASSSDARSLHKGHSPARGVPARMLSRSALPSSLPPAWAVAHQGPLSRRFPRQGYWSGLPFPPPADFPDPGIKLAFPASPVGGIFTAEPPGMPASSLILAHFGLGAPDNKCVLFEVTKFVVLSH